MDCTIKEVKSLYSQPIKDEWGNIYGDKAPSDFELMDKINELTDTVNSLIKLVQNKENP